MRLKEFVIQSFDKNNKFEITLDVILLFSDLN